MASWYALEKKYTDYRLKEKVPSRTTVFIPEAGMVGKLIKIDSSIGLEISNCNPEWCVATGKKELARGKFFLISFRRFTDIQLFSQILSLFSIQDTTSIQTI